MHTHTFFIGPQVVMPVGKVKLFARALFGAARISIPGSPEISQFTYASSGGGGIDYDVLPRVGLRLGQFDYIHTNFGNNDQNHFRYATGLVLRF